MPRIRSGASAAIFSYAISCDPTVGMALPRSASGSHGRCGAS